MGREILPVCASCGTNSEIRSLRRLDLVLFDLDDTLHDDTLCLSECGRGGSAGDRGRARHRCVGAQGRRTSPRRGFWQRLSADDLEGQALAHSCRCGSPPSRALGSGCRGWPSAPRIVTTTIARSTTRSSRARSICLRLLKERGMKLGWLPTASPRLTVKRSRSCASSEFFDAIFIADEVGMIKPDPLLFAHACSDAGRRAARAAMVGDRLRPRH